jgi:hypothetical protein
MREAVEQGGSLPVCLSLCVQRAALKALPPFGTAAGFRSVSIGLSWILLTIIPHVPTSLDRSRTNIFIAPFVDE